MYLESLFIKNIGAIESISLDEKELLLNNQNPKPIILLGKNGTGKTTLLSIIVDSLYELSNKVFDDILPKEGMGYKYFKIHSNSHIKLGSNFGFSYVRYKNDNGFYEYLEKCGEVNSEIIKLSTSNIVSDRILESDSNKNINLFNNDEKLKDDFYNNSYCYFPSDRYEVPYWINDSVKSSKETFGDTKRFSNQLGRDIMVRKALDRIKSWILDVFLDSRADIIFNDDGTVQTRNNLEAVKVLQKSVYNIESLLSKILQKDIRINLNFRVLGSRIKIIDAVTNQDYIPSLDKLSAGQSTLLSIFGTIIQYSDDVDLNKSIYLKDIEGIVIIDEIDLHLHIELQYTVLPSLMRLFPKVQFIITTHSPFFVSGLLKEYSENELLILDMKNGNKLNDLKDFEEFDRAYNLFIDINNNYKYELEKLEEEISNSNKPLIITEGKTDWKHLKAALESCRKELDIEFFEYEDDIKMGSSKLMTMKDSFKNIKNNRLIIFVFDRDEPKIINEIGTKEFEYFGNNVYAFCIPKLSEELDSISIEYYYKHNVFEIEDSNGRRIFSGLDFYLGSTNSKCGKYQTRKIDKSGKPVVIDDNVFKSDDPEMKNSIALSKNDFAENILYKTKNFSSIDFSNFNKIFDVISKIISSSK